MLHTSTLTTEFAYPLAIPDRWLSLLTQVWNQSVFYLNWLQHYRRAEKYEALDLPATELKVMKARFESTKKDEGEWTCICPLGRDFRIDKTKSWDAPGNVQFRYCCSIVKPLWLTPPPIDNYSAISLRKPFAKKCCDWVRESDIPMVFVNDFIGCTVVPSWEAYQKGDRGKPKYRHKDRDRVRSIASDSFRGQCGIDGDKIKLPGLPWVQFYKLSSRLLKPIANMIAAMESEPEGSASYQRKYKKLMQEGRRQLAKAEGLDLKKMDEGAIAALEARVDTSGFNAKVLEYFSKPGSFCLVERDGGTYLQLTAEMPVSTPTETTKEVGVDTGVDLLINATNGLRVGHQTFFREETRIGRLQQVLSTKVYGSSNYNKLQAKIRKIQGEVARSKRSRQAYFATQLADVNGVVKVKKIEIKEAVGRPVPRPDGEGGYLPNGAAAATEEHKKIAGASSGQFIVLLEQQAKKRGRNFSKVTIEIDSSPEQVLSQEAPILGSNAQTPLSAESAQAPTRKEQGKGKVTQSQMSGKPSKATAQIAQNQQEPELASLANPAPPLQRKKRNRRREEAIG